VPAAIVLLWRRQSGGVNALTPEPTVEGQS
jgi:hypothetical protein